MLTRIALIFLVPLSAYAEPPKRVCVSSVFLDRVATHLAQERWQDVVGMMDELREMAKKPSPCAEPEAPKP